MSCILGPLYLSGQQAITEREPIQSAAAEQLAAVDPAGARKVGDPSLAEMRENGSTVARAAGQLPARASGQVPTGLLTCTAPAVRRRCRCREARLP
jgi:hypothetical protein